MIKHASTKALVVILTALVVVMGVLPQMAQAYERDVQVEKQKEAMAAALAERGLGLPTGLPEARQWLQTAGIEPPVPGQGMEEWLRGAMAKAGQHLPPGGQPALMSQLLEAKGGLPVNATEMQEWLSAYGIDDPAMAEQLGGFVGQLTATASQAPHLGGGGWSGGGEYGIASISGPDQNGCRPVISWADVSNLNSQSEITDTDADSIPDAVERLLGTNWEKADSDSDQLSDYNELSNGTDPLSADTNGDGLSDNLEFVSSATDPTGRDFDHDGVPNACDPDNDNDGVPDGLDASPFAKSDSKSSLKVNIQAGNGKPTDVTFQVRPSNSDFLRLPQIKKDWPLDSHGTMQNRSGATGNVQGIPMLELSGDRSIFPLQSQVADYGIKITDGKAYIPLSPVTDNGEVTAMSGRMSWPAGVNSNVEARLVWMVNGKTDKGQLSWSQNKVSPEFGWENQGGGAVTLDINGNGKLDLVLMGIDNPSGGNQYWYRIGWDLDTAGNPSSWSTVIAAPFLIGDTTLGGGLASYDINSNGKPDLLFMGIDAGGWFMYNIAWDLNTSGIPSSWQPAVASGGIGTNFQGGGAALVDVNGNGRPELFLTGIQRASDKNKFTYMFGWDLNTSGQPSSWSTLFAGPYIGANPTAGGGAAIADVNGNGRPDLLLMAIDNPSGANSYKYSIGWDLDQANGHPHSWSVMETVGGLGHEDQGGGATLADINGDGKLDLLLAGLDNPPGANQFWYKVAVGAESEFTTLARYQTDFMLTGLRLEENHGSDAGLFYSESPEQNTARDQVVAANVTLAYEFLRSQSTLSSMPGILAGHNLTVSFREKQFSSSHAANISLIKEMIPAALDKLPKNNKVPVLVAFEDRVAVNDGISAGTGAGADYTVSPGQVVTSRLLKTMWYDTTLRTVMTPEDVLVALPQWYPDLDQNSLAMMRSLVAAWGIGEGSVVKIGATPREFIIPEKNKVLSWMNTLGPGGVQKAIVAMQVAVGAYAALTAFTSFWGTSIGFVARAKYAFGMFQYAFGNMSQASTGVAGGLNRITSIAKGIGWALTAAMAIYSFFQIASESGWSPVGIVIGAIYAVLQLAYAVVTWAIGMIPVVGWIISAVIAIADLLVGFITGKGFVQWMMEGVMAANPPKPRSEINLVNLDNKVNIDDSDNNGLTIGDRIEFKARMREEVKRTATGAAQDVAESYITPNYNSSIQSGLATELENFRNTISSSTNYPYSRQVEHDLGVRFRPAVAMPDLPVAIWLWTASRINYDQFGYTQKSEGKQSFADNPLWLYFDVMPRTLGDFMSWPYLSSGDFDGDGIPNAEEAQYVKIVNKNSGQVLAVEGASQSEGANIGQYPFSDEDHYKWKIQSQPGRTLIYAKHSGKVLSGQYGSPYVVQFTYDGEAGQRWTLQPVGDGYFKITDSYGSALGVEGASKTPGVRVGEYPYVDADNFKWKLEPVSSDSYYKITAKHSGKALDVYAGSRDDGANVDQWSYSGADYQKWRLVPAAHGGHNVVNKNSGKALGVAGSLLSDGANVAQYTPLDSPAMEWKLDPQANGYYRIINMLSGKDLDVRGVETGDGANVQQYGWAGADNQLWKLDKVETVPATDPWRSDTDGDGLSDKFELGRGTDPSRADTDGEGLPDGLEIRQGTDPRKADSDGDGLSDFEEYRGWDVNVTYRNGTAVRLRVWSKPLVADADGDGLGDLQEFQKKTNPQSRDSDGDGVADDVDPSPTSFGSALASNQYYKITSKTDGKALRGWRSYPGDTMENVDLLDYKGIDLQKWRFEPQSDGTYRITNQQSGFALAEKDSYGSLYVYQTPPATDSDRWRAESVGGGYYKLTNVKYNRALYANGNSTIMTLPYQGEYDGFKWSLDAVQTIATSAQATYRQPTYGWTKTSASAAPVFILDDSDPDLDTDGDGLKDAVETAGWDITTVTNAITQTTTFTNTVSMPLTSTVHVISDPGLMDTDLDGLADADESELYSNPQAVDTDGDGLTDLQESKLGTSLVSFDTDGDGLDDGAEITFQSNPKLADTDGDGLSDLEEWQFGSNPRLGDSDGDGLTDAEEKQFGSSLLKTDSEGDGLPDKREKDLGTDAWKGDSDGDGVTDGDEATRATDPLKADTDSDGLSDGEERDLWTNPLLADSDGDGLTDKEETQYGTNPLDKDTDYDGINDSMDPDTKAASIDEITVLYDGSVQGDTTDFIDGLSKLTKVTYGTLDAIRDYQGKPYLVLLAKPGQITSTVGNIAYNVIPEEDRERYSSLPDGAKLAYVNVWPDNKVTMIIPHVFHGDSARVLTFLKNLRAEVLDNSVSVTYPISGDAFDVNARDEVGVGLEVKLLSAVQPSFTITRYNENKTPKPMTGTSGLGRDEAPIGRYVDIQVSENIQSSTGSNVDTARIKVYYTALDLDKTPDGKDGDASDMNDVDETRLTLYRYDETAKKWVKLAVGVDGVKAIGVETTDIGGYAGYAWADVSHFSLYAAAGNVIPPSTRLFLPLVILDSPR